ncbi:MAG: polymerase subunit delta [Candidatus Hydrogenedentes bacterium]|nr:polymerase subunit delta [Candidatus Hydrogenedentota bacterium]
MSFSDVRDQDVPIRLLRSMLSGTRIPNGLMFWGPAGVGKQLTAMRMAQAVNCKERADDACGQCLSCRKTANGNHPDVKVVAPVRKARVIDVEAIESINEFASLRAFEGAWRVFILVDADRMNVAAQNHFLKTLEEPAGNSLFILVTAFPRVLLPTIRSRCQQIRFGALRPETVADLLIRERQIAPELARSIAELAQGQVSRALDLVDSEKRDVVLDITKRLAEGENPLALSEEFYRHLAEQRERIAASVKADVDDSFMSEASPEDKERLKAEQLALVDALCRRDIMEYLYLLETWYRDVAISHIDGGKAFVFNRDQAERLDAHPEAALDKKVAAVEKARVYLERFLNEERVLRDLFFALAP